MKTKYLCTGAALACALVLSACGGDDDVFPDVPIQVNLAGVTQEGLTLKINGGAPVKVDPGTLFTFPDKVPANSYYKVELGGTIPPNATACTVFNGEASVGISIPDNIVVNCTLITYKLGGTISGPLTSALTINNGSGSVTVPANSTSFTLPGVPEGVPYSVTILKQPDAEECFMSPAGTNPAVAPPVGTMPKGELTNLAITCRVRQVPAN